MLRRWRPRLARLCLLALAALPGGAALAACGGGPSELGTEACSDVSHSLALYHRSLETAGVRAAVDRQRALTELRLAMRDAALASTEGGSWQALEATLEESSRVPEGDLTQALAAQCAGAGGS